MSPSKNTVVALLPMVLFLALFIGIGAWFSHKDTTMAFCQLSPTVPIVPVIVWALWQGKNTIAHKISMFFRAWVKATSSPCA